MPIKMPKRAAIKKEKITPDDSAYSMKRMDRATWQAFVKRAHGEGRSVRWVLDQFIASYARREPLNLELEGR